MVWVETMTRIAEPVLSHLADGTLKADMPFESFSTNPLRREVSYLEAFGRTVCGIAPADPRDRKAASPVLSTYVLRCECGRSAGPPGL